MAQVEAGIGTAREVCFAIGPDVTRAQCVTAHLYPGQMMMVLGDELQL
jgi:hypothetical protein